MAQRAAEDSELVERDQGTGRYRSGSIPKERITQERLKQLVSYDPETGALINLVGGKGRPPVGSRAGSQRVRGYRSLDLDGVRYLEHRIVWFYVTGEWPQDRGLYVDHINNDRADNRFANLRLATDTENQRNRAMNKTNSHGLKGVCMHMDPKRAKRYGARIKVDYQSKHLGWFATPEEAHCAYREAAFKFFGQFARTS